MPREIHKVGAQPEVEPRFVDAHFGSYEPPSMPQSGSLASGLNLRQKLDVKQNRCSLASEYYREEMAEMPTNKV